MRTTTRHVLGSLVGLAAVLGTPAVAAADTVRVAIGEWRPYFSRDLEHFGLGARIVTEAFARSGIEVEYRFYPWKRAYFEARQGDQDATAIWTKTPERLGELLYTDPVVSADKVFFHSKDTRLEWDTVQDLAGYRLGATRGYSYGDAFDRAAKNGILEVERVTSDQQNFEKLIRERIDAFPMVEAVGYSILNTKFEADRSAGVTHHPRVIERAVYHLLVSKNVAGSERIVQQFNEGLEQLRASGKLEQYMEESRRGEYIPD